MRAATALVLLTSLTFAGSVLADPSPGRDVARMVTDDCARARQAGKTCVLDVSAEEVDGQVPGGSDIAITVPKFLCPAPSLIRLRRDFIAEIVKTAEDL